MFALYWLTRWPWLVALLTFLVLAAVLPASVWYVHGSLIVLGTVASFFGVIVIREKVVWEAAVRRILDERDF